MKTIEKTIEIKAPLNEVYNQWTQFETFPAFMEGVEAVRQIDEKHLHWVANVAGKKREWDAEIVEQVPDQRIAWRSLTGAPNAGTVNFRPKDHQHTLVTLQMNYQPEGAAENVGDSLGLLSRRVEGDLNRFRDFIQHRTTATGGWRGEIKGPKIKPRSDYGTSGKSGLP
ncbi:MAG TPA: SRPBCC family protein [Verrucomicrobiae bacterium]|nr:SRPBCC family protein [Verrucomicrobiae bacterium]